MKLNQKTLLSLTLLIGCTIYPHLLVAAPTIFGTPGPDLISADLDTTTIYGFQGDDFVVIYAREIDGPVFVAGGDGVDHILAFNAARNDLRGDNGDDFVTGGRGDDEISGGLGDDLLNGYWGHDTIEGNQGNDTIFGGRGYDSIDGNSGNDLIKGGEESDFIYGGTGDDRIEGGPGWDYLAGERGDDILIGGDSQNYPTDDSDGGDGLDECREVVTAISCEI